MPTLFSNAVVEVPLSSNGCGIFVIFIEHFHKDGMQEEGPPNLRHCVLPVAGRERGGCAVPPGALLSPL